jgi:SAM-dependent methyltransferase
MPQIIDPLSFRETVYAFQTSRIILTAMELEVFTAAGENGISSQDAARHCHADPRALDRLMNALVAVGLLVKKDGRFFNSDFARQFLISGKDGYLQGYGHTRNMWNTWSGLTEAVKKGHGKLREERNSEAWTKEFIAAMHMRAAAQAPAVIEKLPMEGVQRVLDIGGGSGAYSIAFAKAESEVRVDLLDLPSVLPFTAGYVKQAGLEDRIRLLPGNYHEYTIAEKYDLIFLSAIVHINSSEENTSLVKRCAHALNPGGCLVIQDHVMDEDRTAPAAGAFFALNMLVATERGDTYTFEEMQGWMTAAGLRNIRQIPTFNNAMILGSKTS